ncbi:MAG TPA: tetratricopeptide repeat protein [Gemmatimonadaceae bacterium]|nr:tetratricopeptide repeat protein [Gemmatimonadaceae bacterium]
MVSSDVGDFESALADGRLEEAVELYRGPLLMGVHLREGREFAEWLESESATLLRRYRTALQELISRSRRLGDLAEGVKRAGQAVDSDPYNAVAARQLVDALLAAGDRPGAVLAAESYSRRITGDLQLDPDPSVLAQLDLLHTLVPPPAAIQTPPEMRVSGNAPARTYPGGGAETVDDYSTGSPSKPRTRSRRTGVVLLATGGLALGAVVVSTFTRGTGARVRPVTSVAVLPFSVHGDSAQAYLADGMARLVANGIDGVGPLRAGVYPGGDNLVRSAWSNLDSANALLRRFRLDRYVTGEVFVLRGSVEVRAALHDASRGGRVMGTASSKGTQDSVFALAESISRQVLGLEPTAGQGGLIRGASDATPSLSAFKAFIEGEAHLRASRFADAVASFQRAIKEDTTFAVAYYRLTVAADWSGQGELIPAATETAKRLASRLAWRERMLLEGSIAWRLGHNDMAESRLHEITTRDPNDAEAWFQLAEVLFHSNSIRGRSFLESRVPFERVIVLDPTNRGALSHLARIRMYLGDTRGADSLLRQAATLITGGLDPELSLFHAIVSGDVTARETAMQGLALEPPWVVQVAASRIASYARDVGLADSVLRRNVRRGVGAPNADFSMLHAMFAAAQGQFGRALEHASVLAEAVPFSGLEVRALLLSLPGSQYSEQDRHEVGLRLRDSALSSLTGFPDESWARRRGLEQSVRSYLLGLLAARAGDTAQLRHHTETIAAVHLPNPGGDVARAFAVGLRGRLLALEGDRAGALRELAKAPDPGDQSMQAQLLVNQLPERFLRATLLEQTGRFEEALDVYESLIFGGGTELLLAAPAALQRARLLVRMGRVGEARLDYQTFLRAWERADVGVRAVVDSARRELGRFPPLAQHSQ